MKFTTTDRKNAINFLNSFNKESKEFKFIVLKACKEELENASLNVQTVAMDIARELFGEDFKSGKSGYNKEDIEKIFDKKFIEKHFILENSKTYALVSNQSWVEFKKEYLNDVQEAKCKECGKGFFKRLHDRRYTVIANTITELRNEQGVKSTDSKGKKKSLAELIKAVKSQLTNKITEKEDGFSKQAILAELDALKAYISEIA